MAQENIRRIPAVTLAGVEGTYGTAATTARINPVSGTFEHTVTQDPIAVDAESAELYDHQSPVLGLKRATFRFDHHLRPADSAPLSTSTVVYPAFVSMLKAWFGGASPADSANVGTTATASPGTATSVNVTSDTNFTAGEWLLIQTANGLEPCRLASKAANTLALLPGLSTTPSANGVVANLVNLYPTPGVDSCSACTIEHAKADSANEQVRLLGCIADIEFSVAQNELVRFSINGRAANWSAGALSISTAVGADTAGSPFALASDAKLLFQDTTTTTQTHVSFEEISFKISLGLEHVVDLGGTVQGTAGIARVADRMFCEVTVTLREDTSTLTDWAAGTLKRVTLMIPRGSGTSRQWLVFDVPRASIEGRPTISYSSSGRMRHTVTLRSQIDTSLSTALRKAPFILAL